MLAQTLAMHYVTTCVSSAVFREDWVPWRFLKALCLRMGRSNVSISGVVTCLKPHFAVKDDLTDPGYLSTDS